MKISEILKLHLISDLVPPTALLWLNSFRNDGQNKNATSNENGQKIIFYFLSLLVLGQVLFFG